MSAPAAPLTRADAQRALDAKTKPLGASAASSAWPPASPSPSRRSRRAPSGRAWWCSPPTTAWRRGVSAYPSAVTAEMTRNFAAGGAAVCVLARAAGAELEVVDVGVDADLGPLAAW
jgi:nicotinate-nucleotide--dimethylbenzimidazole phosphoribosyltransferase